MREKIAQKATVFNSRIDATTTNGGQFEINVRNEFKSKALSGILDTLNGYRLLIGKEAYKMKDSFSYHDKPMNDALNKTEDTPVVFTEQMYYLFELDYINFLIEYYSENLLSRTLFENSTNPLKNLMAMWKLECTQELIAFYKELLKK